MADQLITNDKNIIFGYRKSSNQRNKFTDDKGSTPKICEYCGLKKYPVWKKGGILMYIHNCKARLKSGKPISRQNLPKKQR